LYECVSAGIFRYIDNAKWKAQIETGREHRTGEDSRGVTGAAPPGHQTESARRAGRRMRPAMSRMSP
jgi:hypothetical protein